MKTRVNVLSWRRGLISFGNTSAFSSHLWLHYQWEGPTGWILCSRRSMSPQELSSIKQALHVDPVDTSEITPGLLDKLFTGLQPVSTTRTQEPFPVLYFLLNHHNIQCNQHDSHQSRSKVLHLNTKGSDPKQSWCLVGLIQNVVDLNRRKPRKNLNTGSFTLHQKLFSEVVPHVDKHLLTPEVSVTECRPHSPNKDYILYCLYWSCTADRNAASFPLSFGNLEMICVFENVAADLYQPHCGGLLSQRSIVLYCWSTDVYSSPGGRQLTWHLHLSSSLHSTSLYSSSSSLYLSAPPPPPVLWLSKNRSRLRGGRGGKSIRHDL